MGSILRRRIRMQETGHDRKRLKLSLANVTAGEITKREPITDWYNGERKSRNFSFLFYFLVTSRICGRLDASHVLEESGEHYHYRTWVKKEKESVHK